MTLTFSEIFSGPSIARTSRVEATTANKPKNHFISVMRRQILLSHKLWCFNLFFTDHRSTRVQVMNWWWHTDRASLLWSHKFVFGTNKMRDFPKTYVWYGDACFNEENRNEGMDKALLLLISITHVFTNLERTLLFSRKLVKSNLCRTALRIAFKSITCVKIIWEFPRLDYALDYHQ